MKTRRIPITQCLLSLSHRSQLTGCLFLLLSDETQYKRSPEGETFFCFSDEKEASTDTGRLSLNFATISADDLARSHRALGDTV